MRVPTGEARETPSVLRALSNAIKEAWEEVSAGIAAANERPELASSIVNNGRFLPALNRLFELRKWVGRTRHRPKLSKKQTASFTAFMIRAGVDPQFAVEMAAAPRTRGAPVKKRQAAIFAYEIKLARPDVTWKELARKFCDCGRSQHDFKCQDRLRREVGHLKNFLKKHNIPLT